MHLIDTVRFLHSLSCGDVDNDGSSEVFMAEHDPFWTYRQRNSRFDHHDGAKLIPNTPNLSTKN